MNNYIIVLFKNKKKKKIIKGYKSYKRAFNKFKSLYKQSTVWFDMKYENAEKCKFEIALLSNKEPYQIPLFKEDELGRNEEVFISSDTDYTIIEIKPYKIEEKIYDWQKDERISFDELIRKYCIKKEMKSISTLNNKLVIQNNDEFYLFSLKNIDDSHRLLETMESYYRENSRNDAIFVKDVNTTQRKWMYDILIEKGFEKGKLYRQTTTFSKRK